jgi:hypothetical protein
MIENISNTASDSTIALVEASVEVEGEYYLPTQFIEGGGNIQTVDSTAWIPLVTIRPQNLNSHALALIKNVSASAVKQGATDTDGRIKLEVFKNATLTGTPSWIQKTHSEFEYDKSATGMSGGEAISEHLVKGTANIDFTNICTYNNEFILQLLSGTQETYTLAAKAIATGDTLEVYGAMAWEEYHI